EHSAVLQNPNTSVRRSSHHIPQPRSHSLVSSYTMEKRGFYNLLPSSQELQGPDCLQENQLPK
ncbi:hypothetical protein STEG23_011987, partial [Scotinomys teguina]